MDEEREKLIESLVMQARITVAMLAKYGESTEHKWMRIGLETSLENLDRYQAGVQQ